MPLLEISPKERRAHRASAHHLDPVVLIGSDGLTAPVQKEIDHALMAHGLIKVRVFQDDKEARATLMLTLCEALNCAPIQHIGKLLILWRPIPEKMDKFDENRKAGPKDIKIVKPSKKPGQKPEIKRVQLLGNQRVTAAGTIKRAKPKAPVSIKKRQSK